MMMDGGMGGMMAWMMSLGLLGWVLVVALLVTIVILLIRVLGRSRPSDDRFPPPGQSRNVP
jgi:uncharacterized membrane protein